MNTCGRPDQWMKTFAMLLLALAGSGCVCGGHGHEFRWHRKQSCKPAPFWEFPYYGFHPTCWQRWPADWIGCPAPCNDDMVGTTPEAVVELMPAPSDIAPPSEPSMPPGEPILSSPPPEPSSPPASLPQLDAAPPRAEDAARSERALPLQPGLLQRFARQRRGARVQPPTQPQPRDQLSDRVAAPIWPLDEGAKVSSARFRTAAP